MWERASWLAFLALFAASTLAVAKIPLLPDTNAVVERFTGPEFAALTVLSAAAAVTWAVGWFLGGREVRLSWMHGALAAVCASAALSAFFARVRPLAIVGESGRYVGLVTWICCALALFLATQLIRSSARLTIITRVVIAVGAIEAVIGISQVLGLDILRFDFPEQYRWMLSQGVGTIGNPNQFSTVLLIPFILACSEALSTRDRLWRPLTIAATILIGIALVASATRGSWVGAVVGVIVLAVLALRCQFANAKALWIGTAVLAGTLVVGALVADSAILGTRFDATSSDEPAIEQLSNGRLSLWRQGADVFAQHPVLGVGPDSLRNAYKAAGHSTGILGVFTDDPHSLPLLVALSFGIVGIVAMVWFLLAALRAPVMQVIHDPKCASDATLSRMNGWLAGTFALLTASLVSVTSLPMLLALALALGVVQAPYTRRARQVRVPVWTVSAVGVALVAFVAVALGASLVPLYHNARITQTELALPLSYEAVAVLDAADRALPWRYEMLSRRTSSLIDQAALEHSQGGAGVAAAETRLADLRSHLDARVAEFPAEYVAWHMRAQSYIASAVITGDPELAERSCSIVAEALDRFPNDLELIELEQLAQKL